jgi:hypothetical protein
MRIVTTQSVEPTRKEPEVALLSANHGLFFVASIESPVTTTPTSIFKLDGQAEQVDVCFASIRTQQAD